MFYCDPCGTSRAWPTNTLMRSHGPCETCGTDAVCNDVPSSLLPLPAGMTVAPLDHSADRYFVTTDGRGEREVDKAEYVATEHAAGFRSHYGPDEVATGSFSGAGLRGRVVYSHGA